MNEVQPKGCRFVHALDQRVPSSKLEEGFSTPNTNTWPASSLTEASIPEASGYHTNTHGGSIRFKNRFEV